MADDINATILIQNLTNQVRDLSDRIDKRFDSMEAKFDRYVTESKFQVYKEGIELRLSACDTNHKTVREDVDRLKAGRLPQWAVGLVTAVAVALASHFFWPAQAATNTIQPPAIVQKGHTP
jgi:hypothetical protein